MVARRLVLLSPPPSLARCAATAPRLPLLLRPVTSGLVVPGSSRTRAPALPSWPAAGTRSLATTGARFEASRRPDPSSTVAPSKVPLSPEEDQPLAPEPGTATSAPPPPPPRRRRRGLIYAVVFLCLGVSLGSAVRLALAPPTPPTPGSAADRELVAYFRQRGEELALVRQLTADPAWESWDAYGADGEDIGAGETVIATTEEEGQGRRGPPDARLTSGALAGVRGLPFQRVFWHRASGEVVSVVYFGAGTAGWPGVVHGGALATVLDETLGRCAILQFPARTGVTARLELNYQRPTNTAAFYVLRARPCLDAAAADGTDGARKSDRKMWVEGSVETTDGRRCVTARALFVVPKGFKLKPLETRF